MKRFLCLILILSMCLSLCACGGSSGEPQMPTEPENWIISPQYVAGKVTEFMTTEEYQKMAADFEAGFFDATQKLIVRRPYVDAAIEFYMAEPACHLLILLVKGDFGWDGSYSFELKIIYDMDSGIFYDGMVGYGQDLNARYPGISGTPIESLLFRPNAIYTTDLGSEPLYTQYEIYRTLTAEELAVVNTALGVEEPVEGVLYELPTELPTEAPTETPTEAPVEASTEMPVDEPNEDVPPVESDKETPITTSGEVTVTEQFLRDATQNFQSSKRYQDIASDPSSIHITSAFEYTLSDFQGYDVQVLLVRVDGIDTDMWGFSADTFLVDIRTGTVYHDNSLDVNNWGNFETLEHAFACIICTPVWNQDMIWGGDEVRTDLPQSVIDAVNGQLNP